METITNIFIYSGMLCGIFAFCIWLYEKSYARGYSHGRHSGFSEGLFKAHERMNIKNQKEKLIYRQSIYE
jgi:hypothetical protein